MTYVGLLRRRLFDVSKQVVGQMFVHGVNVFLSDFGSNHTEGNACVFYFLNILIDTTLGVFVSLVSNWRIAHLLLQVLLSFTLSYISSHIFSLISSA